MNFPTDANTLSLVRALKPFLSEKGRNATDDLLGAANIVSIVESVSTSIKKKNRMRTSGDVNNERPLAFLSTFANLRVNPEMIASAIEMLIDTPQSDPGTNYKQNEIARSVSKMNQNQMPNNNNNNDQQQISPDIAALLQTFMNKATTDPNFAAMISDAAKNGVNQNTLSQIVSAVTQNNEK